MNFRTELHLHQSPWTIDLKHPILTMGSCFAQTMGQRFQENKFTIAINPFGATYHPFAIYKQLKYIARRESPPDQTYLYQQGIFLNYDFHSSFSDTTKEGLQNQIQNTIGTIYQFLKTCKVLVLTYGTAWIYERIETNEGVANCHKIPANQFTKRLCLTDELVTSFRDTLTLLRSINKDLKIILTVSPVRHVKESLPLNAVSKSVLRTACHIMSLENQDVEYFPAFEIMIDDLRDYRFYKEDLIHPTVLAENYIWEKFGVRHFNATTLDFLGRWQEVRHALAHKPFHPESPGHQKFIHEILHKLSELKSFTDVEQEESYFKKQLLA